HTWPPPTARTPSGLPVPTAPNRHRWWALAPAYPLGMVSFIPVLHAAIRLRRTRLWWAAGVLAVGSAVAAVLVNTTPDDSVASNVGVVLAICLAVAGTVLALQLREEMFAQSDALASAHRAARFDPAVAQVLAARQRRREATALVAREPGLARDLRIGRPDLPRRYDDGGLVDVNHVPEVVLVSHLGLTAEQAAAVGRARERLGRFESAQELEVLTNLPPSVLDPVRDRVVTL
ncbi:MAG: hypothetical protein HOQ22_04900, partial [Nocardioidaceae bacterium]|nr:hypothetical protein [Nocardioidaceae bacterium]